MPSEKLRQTRKFENLNFAFELPSPANFQICEFALVFLEGVEDSLQLEEKNRAFFQIQTWRF